MGYWGKKYWVFSKPPNEAYFFYLECVSDDKFAEEVSKQSIVGVFWNNCLLFCERGLGSFQEHEIWQLFSRIVLKLSYCSGISQRFKYWVFGKNWFLYKRKLIFLKIRKLRIFSPACASCSNAAQEISKRSKNWDFWKCRWVFPRKNPIILKNLPFWQISIEMDSNGIFVSEIWKNFKRWGFLENYLGFLEKIHDTFLNHIT